MTSRRRRIPVGVYVFRPHIHQGALSSNLMSLPTVFYCPPPVRAIFSLYITGENPSQTNLTRQLQSRQKYDIIQPYRRRRDSGGCLCVSSTYSSGDVVRQLNVSADGFLSLSVGLSLFTLLSYHKFWRLSTLYLEKNVKKFLFLSYRCCCVECCRIIYNSVENMG